MYKFKKIDFDVTEYFGALQQYFGQRKDIDLVYLFGSYAQGNITSTSDIDIAYLPSRIFSFHDEMALELDLVRILRTEEIDCVNLYNTPPSLGYKIITTGKIILCQKPLAREFFESRTLLDYFDLQPIRERYFQKMRQEILQKGD